MQDRGYPLVMRLTVKSLLSFRKSIQTRVRLETTFMRHYSYGCRQLGECLTLYRGTTASPQTGLFYFYNSSVAESWICTLTSKCTASSIAQWYSACFECGRSRVQSTVKDRLLDSLVVECWLRVREVPDSRTASYQRRYKNGTSSALV